MKKTLFLFATAAIALASCSSDDTIAENMGLNAANEINLRPFVAGNTRATETAIGTLSQFTVDAYRNNTTTAYFTNVVFKKNTPGTTYTSDTKYYWPSDYNLDFFAYGYANDIKTGITKDDKNQFTVITNSDPDEQVDLVYAKTLNWGKATGAGTDHAIPANHEGVVANFRHAQSQIVVKLKNSNSNLKFTVNSVKLGNVKDRGQVTIDDTNTDGSGVLSNASWNTGITGVQDVTYDLEATAAAVVTTEEQAGKSLVLIPQTLPAPANTYEGTGTPKEYTKPYILVDLKIQNNATGGDPAYIIGKSDGVGEYVTVMWPLPAITWAPGYKYTYTVDLAGGGYAEENQDADDDLDPILENAEIKFVSVSVDTWGDGGNTTIGNLTFAKAGTYTENIADETGTYYITITGLTPTYTIEVTGGTPASATVGISGSVTITVPVTAGSSPTNVTVVEKNTVPETVSTTNISLVHP